MLRMDCEDQYQHYTPGEDDGPTEGWCASCGEQCRAITVDNGIGAYEYWGYKGVHRQLDIESECCNARVLDSDPDPGEEDTDAELDP